MKKKKLAVVLVLLVLWVILAAQIDNEFKLPLPFHVLETMIAQVQTSVFYEAIFMSLFRSLSGLAIAYVCGVVIGLVCGLNTTAEALFSPIYLILKSIPNVSYILIALIWTSNETAVKIICFMILFPMVYGNILNGMKDLDKPLMDLLKLYPATFMQATWKVYLPMLSPYLKASLSTGAGLAFKVGVMAEILGSVSPGIGRQLQICRINMDMSGLFAWTIWILILLCVSEWVFKRLVRYVHH